VTNGLTSDLMTRSSRRNAITVNNYISSYISPKKAKIFPLSLSLSLFKLPSTVLKTLLPSWSSKCTFLADLCSWWILKRRRLMDQLLGVNNILVICEQFAIVVCSKNTHCQWNKDSKLSMCCCYQGELNNKKKVKRIEENEEIEEY